MARRGTRRRATRGSSATSHSASRDPYQEMLDELSPPPSVSEAEHAVKRRRVGGRLVVQGIADRIEENAEASSNEASVSSIPKHAQQTAYTDFEDSEDSESEWEDVDLENPVEAGSLTDNKSVPEKPVELSLVLGGENEAQKVHSRPRRKPVTAEEKKLRLEVHKLNLLCLLSHVHRRNHWCNDNEVQSGLRPLLSRKTLSFLEDDEATGQFQRNSRFVEGLKQACNTFNQSFTINARGMARCSWADDVENISEFEVPEDIELPIEKTDFRQLCRNMRASRDVGAQLFCALLRSAGVDARLVCSLQPLPLTATSKGTTPVKSKPMMTVTYPETRIGLISEGGPDNTNSTDFSHAPTGTRASGPMRAKPRKKHLRESQYPIYWVEAFNAAYQKWVPIDSLVTGSVGKPSRLEPPASDSQNNLTYVVAFDEDGSARDVTRRYASAYNSKTRKRRVESTKGGEKWLKRVMKMYKLYHLDRDQVEDAELSKKEAQEPMPKNVQDFKDHPYYALARHLKRNEVIHPQRQIGKVSIGKGGLDSDKALESIFRRRDVHVVKSADSWYRLGREIKVGEQPLKRVQSRKRKATVSDDESDSEDNAGTPMYAGFQTCVYHAPPIVDGRVPRNQFGNLDVYVGSMVPPGGAHIIHRDVSRAARLLGIDYADAVTGFEFKGRHGTAIIKGAVVGAEYVKAVLEVLQGYHDQQTELELRQRSVKSLRLWKRLMAGLRIRERIQSYDIEGDQDAEPELQDELDDIEEAEQDDAGGFLPDRGQPEFAEPTPHHLKKSFEGVASTNHEQPRDVNTLTGSDIVPEFLHPQVIFGPQVSTTNKDVRPNEGDVFNDHELGGLSLVGSGGFLPEDTIMLDHDTNSHGDHGDESARQSIRKGNAMTAPIREAEEGRIDQLFESQDVLNQDVPASQSAIKSEHQSPLQSSNTAYAVDDESPTRMLGERKGSEMSDKGSLLSHDPEDEDADPEWLV